VKHLKNDFSGAEPIRLMLKNIPRYGTGTARADWWARRISSTYTDLVKRSPTPAGFNVIPGLFSHGDVYGLGRELGATPNGRHAGKEISHSADPDPGFARDGTAAPTAKSNAVASVQPGWGNSAPLQLDLDSHLLVEEGGVKAVEALIRGHNRMSGTLINLNIVSRQQILAAHADPNAYPDLVVRVTGYSAYFHSLSPEYRQQIVDRFLG
jgi:formate C-acetyltransferase